MKWNDTWLDAQRQVCDPPADAVIAALVQDYGPAKAREVFGLLIRNIDMPFAALPPYVRDYVDTQSALPTDVNAAQIVRGQKVFVDFGPEIALMLYFKSLPTTYLNGRLCETLSITGRLDDQRKWPEVFSRRVGETTQFLMDVMTPGSLQLGGKGIATTLKVRLVHASIRYFVERSPKYNLTAWQKPINQDDLAFTLLTFGYTMVQGMRQMKLKLSEERAADFYAAWKLVGHFLGIQTAMIPVDLADAAAQQSAMFPRLVQSTDAGKSITKALLDFARESMLPTEMLDNSPEFLLRYFMGGDFAELLGVQPKKGCVAAAIPQMIAKYFEATEAIEDRGLGLERLSNRLGLAVIKGMMRKFQSAKGQGLVVPEDLKAQWGIV